MGSLEDQGRRVKAPTCNECGEPATYLERGWADEEGAGQEDAYWCEKHKQRGDSHRLSVMTTNVVSETELGVFERD